MSFKELAKDKNEIKVLVYTNEDDDGFKCPKCGEKIKLNTEKIDDIILSINNLKETIDSAKLLIENMIKVSSDNNVNITFVSNILYMLRFEFLKDILFFLIIFLIIFLFY